MPVLCFSLSVSRPLCIQFYFLQSTIYDEIKHYQHFSISYTQPVQWNLRIMFWEDQVYILLQVFASKS